jgi:TM2 domain-containing membrane protein YozV
MENLSGGISQAGNGGKGRQFSVAVQGATAPRMARPEVVAGPQPERNYIVTLALGAFFGALGADRFYLGKTGTGLIKLLTAGGVTVWWALDLLWLATGKATDKEGRIVTYTGSNEKIVRIFSWIAVGFVGLIAAFYVFAGFLGVILSIAAA